MNAVAKILTDAADLIDAKGWVQGVSVSADGCYCLLAAMNSCSAGEDYFSVRAAVAEEIGSRWPADWNDTEGRTQAEVTAMLRAVAAKQVSA